MISQGRGGDGHPIQSNYHVPLEILHPENFANRLFVKGVFSKPPFFGGDG